MTTYVKEIKDIETSVLSVGKYELTAYRAGSIVSNLCFSHLYRKIGYKRSNLILLWLTCAFLLSMDEAQDIKSISALNSLIGFSISVTLPNTLSAISDEVISPYRSTAIAFAISISMIAVVVGPLVLSYVIKDFGIEILLGVSIIEAFVASISNIHDPVNMIKEIKMYPTRVKLAFLAYKKNHIKF